ncbi:MAG: putative photosynthetic complex assembly protein PuhE [Pseudomonadota bacterium]
MLALAVLYALAVWWSTTQALLWLVRSAPKHALNALALCLAAACGALAVAAADDGGAHAAFVGFTAGIGLWAAFEITFLTGAILGVDVPSYSDRWWAKAWSAFQAIIWHELALIITLAVLLVATATSANPSAAAAFGALWVMRASAKLNLFLGVRNLCTEFLPEPVAHLGKHFRRRTMNAMFPFSVLFATLAAALLLRAGLAPDTSSSQAIASILTATLVGLGVLEHWLMLTPLSALDLWSARFMKASRVTFARPLGATRTSI